MNRRIGIACLSAVVLLVLVQPWLAPFDPMSPGPDTLDGPSREHPLGTDTNGRDVMSRLVEGTWHSLGVALVALVVSTAVGLIVGCVAGLAGGLADRGLTASTDLLLAFPRFVILLNLAAVFTFPDALSIGLLIGLTSWMSTARLVRTEVLSLKRRPFVEAARAAGARGRRVIVLHLIPHLMRLVIERSGLRFAGVILTAASLDYLGIGLSADRPTWGRMVLDGQEHLQTAPWLALSAVGVLCLTVVGLVLLGDRPRPEVAR